MILFNSHYYKNLDLNSPFTFVIKKDEKKNIKRNLLSFEYNIQLACSIVNTVKT